MEGKVRHSLKGAIPYLAPSPEQQGQRTLAQVTPLDPVPTPVTAAWQRQGASPQFLGGSRRWRRQKQTYFRLQYRYMDTIMAASWWERNGPR